ncbi:MAG: membrane protein insertion efficiency factor YidD [Candidatus Puniceispirillaceae bacterium]
MIKQVMIAPLIGLIKIYQLFLSPLLGQNCRFAPSCSAYAIEALQKYGPLRGGLLTVKRMGRCHPWGGSGYDPVPDDTKQTDHRSL